MVLNYILVGCPWFFHCTEIWQNFGEWVTLSFVRYFPFWSDLLKEFNHSEVIWWTLNSCLISLTLFIKQVMILVQPPFRLFTCCVTAVCITEMHSILSISLNSAHNSDSFTSMFLKLKVDIETSIGEIFHLLGNICSESLRWRPNRNAMGYQELTDIFFGTRFLSPQF